jgi:hypothetical protein
MRGLESGETRSLARVLNPRSRSGKSLLTIANDSDDPEWTAVSLVPLA